MENDQDKNITLPQQGVLGDPAVGVVGITVPGAPTSSSYEGLTGVSTAGISEEGATVERSCAALENNPDPEQAHVEEILHNVTVGYESALEALDARVSHTGNMDMEVVQEEYAFKKRKADVSPVVDDSSNDKTVAPHVHVHVLRRTRKNRIVDPTSVGNTIDLTSDSVTPTNLGDTDLADADTDTPGPSGRIRRGTNKSRKKKSIKDIDCNSDLDDISYDELLGMGVNDAGVIGLKCMDVLHEMRNLCQGQLNGKMKHKIKTAQEVINALIARALPSRDLTPLEARIQETTANLEATKKELAKWKAENGILRNENNNLRNEISVIKAEIKKIEEVRIENESLRRQMKGIENDLQNLKKNASRKDDVLKRKSRDVGKSKLQDRLIFREDSSPVAGPSRMLTAGPSDETVIVVPISESKKEVSEHISKMVKNLKETRRRKDSSEDVSSAVVMDWEALPQRRPKSRPRVVANVQLVPPRGSITSDKERSDSTGGKQRCKGG
ncbi:homer protein 2-like protein [Lasius niger]|uniref:Homer protein 2-like protein n=1 Tax=Lasius niger TaxID=67767 RepID=A0A0J7KMM7_LASNI|nr:homer protein 2-like protein [Lasius niger]